MDVRLGLVFFPDDVALVSFLYAEIELVSSHP